MINKEELLKKIKALAENGVGGEKENAQKMLNDLMVKYNIKEEDIEIDAIQYFEFKIPRFFKSKELANQIYYSIVGKALCNNKPGYINLKNSKMKIWCTPAEFLELEAKFKFYFHHYKIEAERFYSAFIQANRIFPRPGQELENLKDNDDLTKEDLEMLSMANTLERHEYRLQITEGNNDNK